MNGRIKMYNENRGFGFIYGDDGKDYYFHVTAARSVDTLFRGREVTFTPTHAKDGWMATEIECLSSREPPECLLLGGLRMRRSAIQVYGITYESRIPPEGGPPKREAVLRVTCEGGETFRFYESDAPFDIYEKQQELDRCLFPAL